MRDQDTPKIEYEKFTSLQELVKAILPHFGDYGHHIRPKGIKDHIDRLVKKETNLTAVNAFLDEKLTQSLNMSMDLSSHILDIMAVIKDCSSGTQTESASPSISSTEGSVHSEHESGTSTGGVSSAGALGKGGIGI